VPRATISVKTLYNHLSYRLGGSPRCLCNSCHLSVKSRSSLSELFQFEDVTLRPEGVAQNRLYNRVLNWSRDDANPGDTRAEANCTNIISRSGPLYPLVAALHVTAGAMARPTTKPVQSHDMVPARGCASRIEPTFLKIGADLIPVYGNDQCGWSLESEDFRCEQSAYLRYRSLDELLFVLINMHVSGEGTA